MNLKISDTFDMLKNKGVEKVIEKVTSVTNSILHTSNDVQQENVAQESLPAIDSVDTLNGYLNSLQSGVSPAVMMALQSQMSVLKYVQSPTMTLVVVDNLMHCLYSALKAAENKQQKETLRESFASLLQSFIFVSEARLRYEIDSNREEAIRLLADAGDMLVSSVKSTAMLAVPVAAGVKMGNAMPRIVNMLASKNEQRSFFGCLIMAKGKKAIIEEKKVEFDKTLNYIFETLDNYAELIGPSMLLHGMLKRYADGLVERYSITQYASVEKMINKNEVEDLEGLANKGLDTPTKREAWGVKMIFSTLRQTTKTPTTLDYESLRNIRRLLQSKLSGIEAQIAKIDNEIEELAAQIKELSILQHNRKEALRLQIGKLKMERDTFESSAMEYQQRICVVSDIIAPAEVRIEEYASKMQRIVDKYEVLLEL